MDGCRTHRGSLGRPTNGFEDRGAHRDSTIPASSISHDGPSRQGQSAESTHPRVPLLLDNHSAGV